MSKKKFADNFEAKLERLEEITSSLESGEVGLDDSIKLFEEAVKLSKECLTTLENAELKVSTLKKELNKISKEEED